jgi:phage terminase large subunit GpA-like protein
MVTNRTKFCFERLRVDLVHPPESLTVLEWAERHLYLSPEYTLAEPGKFRVARTPWIKKPMLDFTNPKVHRQILMFANQMAKTLFEQAVFGRTVHLNPQPILWTMPDEDLAKRLSTERLAFQIRDCAPLRARIKEPKSRDSGNTILAKQFPGGHIQIPGANSPRGLAMTAAGILIFDEADLFPLASGTIGDPIALAEKRATTAFDRKEIISSSPTDEAGRIFQEWLRSDQATWCVPCPKCHKAQSLEWDTAGRNPDKESLTYRCCECKESSTEAEWKHSSEKDGHYIAAFPERATKGYRVNALVHPWLSWAELFREFFKADEELKGGSFWSMKAFRNGRLAQIWESKGSAQTTDPEYFWNNHREIYSTIPGDVVCLTIGTQKDCVYLELCGWTALAGCRAISYQTFGPGDPSTEEFWKPIFAFSRSTFERADGAKLKVSLGCVDIGGAYSDQVKVILNQSNTVLKPVFGRRESTSREVITRSTDGRYYLVNVAMAKDEISFRELTGPENFAMRWLWPMTPEGDATAGYDETYFNQYTAEAQITKYRNGQRITIWEPIKEGDPNHSWDCRVYGYAALVWLRKRRSDFLEREAEAIKNQLNPPRTVYRPPADPRRHIMAPPGATPPGGFGPVEENSPFGTYRPKSGRGHY